MKSTVEFKLPYETILEEVNKIAWKYARKTFNVEVEDFAQDLWLFIIEKNPADVALLRTLLVNKAIDICRKSSREDGGVFSTDINDECQENKLSYSLSRLSPEEQVIAKVSVQEMADQLGRSKGRVYMVTKAYFESDPDLVDMFKSEVYGYIDDMADDIRSFVLDFIESNKKITDDFILKYFCGIKTGSNSSSIRKIKNEDIRPMFVEKGYAI